VAAHHDDPRRAQLRRRENAEEADGTVAHDGDGLARPDLGGNRAEPPGAQHVGRGKEAGNEVVIGNLRSGDEGAVGEGDARPLGLRADGTDKLAVHAGALVAGAADLAGVVGGEERSDHELAGLDVVDGTADFFDDADVLVAHR
jgi:hypothetical protein